MRPVSHIIHFSLAGSPHISWDQCGEEPLIKVLSNWSDVSVNLFTSLIRCGRKAMDDIGTGFKGCPNNQIIPENHTGGVSLSAFKSTSCNLSTVPRSFLFLPSSFCHFLIFDVIIFILAYRYIITLFYFEMWANFVVHKLWANIVNITQISTHENIFRSYLTEISTVQYTCSLPDHNSETSSLQYLTWRDGEASWRLEASKLADSQKGLFLEALCSQKLTQLVKDCSCVSVLWYLQDSKICS